MTLISAPAGYGKTSALVDFAWHTSVPVCWYTIDERNRDLISFIRYIVGAIREQFPGFGERVHEALASRGSELFRDPTIAVGDLVNEILDLGTEFVLVLDNFESVEGAFGIREFVHRLLEVLPSACHLMMGSRVLPDVPITQLVAKRQLVGLTEQDLRFKPEEVVELLRDSKIRISERQAEAVARNAEGWITGILLISDLLREDMGAIISDTRKATSQTYRYLASEVLSRQPWDLRRFLHASSILREMSARLCREVLGIEGAHFLLAEVERRNLFVTRFGDDRRAAYRYHNLFRGFLQERMRQREPTRYAELHQRAAAWFEQEHQVEEAVHHYLAAEAYPQATTLMERVALEWFTRGRVETLLRWAEALPEKIRSQAPRLFLYHSKVLTDRYEHEPAKQALAYAEAGFADEGLLACLARVHLQHATLDLFGGRYEEVIAEAEKALEMLGQQEVAERAQAQRLIGRAHLGRGCFDAGISELEEALGSYREIGGLYNVVNLLQDLAFAFASQGRFERAARCLNEALPIARRLESPALLAGVLNSLGWIDYACGRYREALSLYEEGLAEARRGGDLRGRANILDGMASIYRDVGAYRRAESLYSAAWRISRESRPRQAVLILVARADMHRWQGQHSRALTLLEEARRLAEEKELVVERCGPLAMAEGIALSESGELDAGLRRLSEAVSFLEQQKAKRNLARGCFLLAKARLMAEEKRQAVAELRRAVELAREIGTDQFAVVEAQHAEGLVEVGIREGVEGCKTILDGVQKLEAFRKELMYDIVGPDRVSERRLKIYALGQSRVVAHGEPIPDSAWQAAMARELFFYILLHGPVERDTVGLVFWPDLPSDKMINNFHSTLYRARHAVGSDGIVLENDKYSLGVDYWFDVEAFESLVERARLLPPHDWQVEDLWRQVVELYQGDLLPNVDRPWCISRREALRAGYVEALRELGRCHESRGAFQGAITWYRQALKVDELREDLHRSVMRAYAQIGRRSDAVAHYRQCQETLRQELGVEPSWETRNLYEKLSGGVAD